MPSWEELEEECSRIGGELVPLPCSWYNSYCMEDGKECVFSSEPLFIKEDDDGWPGYCCKRSERGRAYRRPEQPVINYDEYARMTYWYPLIRDIESVMPARIIPVSPGLVEYAYYLVSGEPPRIIDKAVVERAVGKLLDKIREKTSDLGDKVFVRNDVTSCKHIVPIAHKPCIRNEPRTILEHFIRTLECTMPWSMYREFGSATDAPPPKALVVRPCAEPETWLSWDIKYYNRLEVRAYIVDANVVEIVPYYYPSRELFNAVLLYSEALPSPEERTKLYKDFIKAARDYFNTIRREQDEILEALRPVARRLPREITWSLDAMKATCCGEKRWWVIDAAPLAQSYTPLTIVNTLARITDTTFYKEVHQRGG